MERTKFTGVYQHDAKDGTRTYYIQYKNKGKLIREKVGTKGQTGITPTYCSKIREQTLVKLRLGEAAPIQTRTNNKTLNEVAVAYFADSEARSKAKLQSVYNIHIKPTFGSEFVKSIDKEKLDAFRRKKIKQKSPKTGRVFASKTVGNMLSVLSAILGFAHEKKDLPDLPDIKEVIKKIGVNNSRERYLSKDEIRLLLTTIEKSGLPTTDRLLMFVKVSFYTGARLQSVLSIKGKDINRKTGTITIHNHKKKKTAEGDEHTYFSFPPIDFINSLPPLEQHERLVDVSDAKQIQRPLQDILNKLFNVGLNADDRKDRVVIHTLRHSFASHLVIQGTPIVTVKKLMDHSDINMTLKYSHLEEDAGRADVARIAL